MNKGRNKRLYERKNIKYKINNIMIVNSKIFFKKIISSKKEIMNNKLQIYIICSER